MSIIFKLDEPRCPTCGLVAQNLLEPCVKVIPLTPIPPNAAPAGDWFVEDFGEADVEPCADESSDVRLECPNAHYWTSKKEETE